jgi:thioredoxin 1
MNKQEISQRSIQNGKPIILEFWAPWCVPCKIMSPALEKTAKLFTHSVELIRINADEYPNTVKEFGILGIPSLIIVNNGKEAARHTGVLDNSQLETLFNNAAHQVDILIPPTSGQRLLRIGSGLAVVLMGSLWGPPIPLYLLGAGIVFSGLYDRCPIFKMLYPRLKSFLNPKTTTMVQDR